MEKSDIVKRVIQAHNYIFSIPVSGDSVIPMANTINILRCLVSELQAECAETEIEEDRHG